MEEKLDELLEEVRNIRRAFQIFLEKEDQPPPSRFTAIAPSTPRTLRLPPPPPINEGPFRIWNGMHISGPVLIPPQNRFRASLEKLRNNPMDVFINLTKADFRTAVNTHFPRAEYHEKYREEYDYDQTIDIINIINAKKGKKVLLVSFDVKKAATRIALCYLVHLGVSDFELFRSFDAVQAPIDREEAREIIDWMKGEMQADQPPPRKKGRGRPRKKK